MCLEDKIDLYEKIRGIIAIKMHKAMENKDYILFYKCNNRYHHIDNKLQELYKARRENYEQEAKK